jgi:signal transduction histidine kinase
VNEPWWSVRSGFMLLLRTCLATAVLVDVWLGHPAPGLAGHRLILLIGVLVAALAWLAGLPAEGAAHPWRVFLLALGMVGGCLASLMSPNTAATALPAVIGLMAGTSLPSLGTIAVVACGLLTLVTGSPTIATPGFSLLGATLAVVGGALAGLWRRQYILRAEQAELASAEAQRASEEHGRAQVLEERARIAREMHDILAHTLGGLIVQLDAADTLLDAADHRDHERDHERVQDRDHERDHGRELVTAARAMAVKGLQETRQAIAALRADPVALPEMLAGLAAGDGQGEAVRQELDWTPHRLAPGTSLAVYRTAQEALSNVRKHAPGARVAMSLAYERGEAVLRVTNDAPPEPAQPHALAATGAGYGLDGLRERAELLGGTLRAGPDDGGWVVELRVPA